MSTSTSSDAAADMDVLIDSIRSTVRSGPASEDAASSVARVLEDWLATNPTVPGQYRRSDPDNYVQHVVHAEPDGSFSVVALVWLPGQRTNIHDHVSWCVTGVCEGEEREERYELRGDDSCVVPVAEVTNPVGTVCGFAPPGDIHRVRNSGDALTISLHVYGADISELGSSIRRSYSLPVVAAE